jgi:hypothetical protein
LRTPLTRAYCKFFRSFHANVTIHHSQHPSGAPPVVTPSWTLARTPPVSIEVRGMIGTLRTASSIFFWRSRLFLRRLTLRLAFEFSAHLSMSSLLHTPSHWYLCLQFVPFSSPTDLNISGFTTSHGALTTLLGLSR